MKPHQKHWLALYRPPDKDAKVWGVRAIDAGYTVIPTKTVYPPRHHPDAYLFTWERGRVFSETSSSPSRAAAASSRPHRPAVWTCTRATSLTVTQIAAQTGFASVFYFTRYFVRRTGVSPTAWRGSNAVFSTKHGAKTD